MSRHELYAHRGYIYVDRRLIDENPLSVMEVFTKIEFLPLRINWRFESESYIYIGLSPRFTSVPAGEKTPYYKVIGHHERTSVSMFPAESLPLTVTHWTVERAEA
jgi:hypothetical protein